MPTAGHLLMGELAQVERAGLVVLTSPASILRRFRILIWAIFSVIFLAAVPASVFGAVEISRWILNFHLRKQCLARSEKCFSIRHPYVRSARVQVERREVTWSLVPFAMVKGKFMKRAGHLLAVLPLREYVIHVMGGVRCPRKNVPHVVGPVSAKRKRK